MHRLRPKGYKGVFRPKSRIHDKAEHERPLVDGCAIFYKADKFRLHSQHLVEYITIPEVKPELRSNPALVDRFKSKDNIALLVLFESIKTGKKVLVVDTHLHWNPQFEDVKLVQTVHLMNMIEAFLGDQSGKTPILIGCDFNQMPYNGACEFIHNGKISGQHRDFGNLDYGTPLAKYLHHGLDLKSAYSNIGEERPTNWTPNFKAVIDYIWYSKKLLEPLALVAVPDLSGIKGLPNRSYPSDHVCLVAEFQLK